jgi:transcription elongation factor Elf1
MKLRTSYAFKCPKCGAEKLQRCAKDTGESYENHTHKGRRLMAAGANEIIRKLNKTWEDV